MGEINPGIEQNQPETPEDTKDRERFLQDFEKTKNLLKEDYDIDNLTTIEGVHLRKILEQCIKQNDGEKADIKKLNEEIGQLSEETTKRRGKFWVLKDGVDKNLVGKKESDLRTLGMMLRDLPEKKYEGFESAKLIKKRAAELEEEIILLSKEVLPLEGTSFKLKDGVDEKFFLKKLARLKNLSLTEINPVEEAAGRWLIELYGIAPDDVYYNAELEDLTTHELYGPYLRLDETRQKNAEIISQGHTPELRYTITPEFKEYLRRLREKSHLP